MDLHCEAKHMTDLLFAEWGELGRTALVGVLAYMLLILLLRLSGKRTLSRMNSFDLIVNVSLGSILGAILLNPSVSLAQGIAALVSLVALQFSVTWSSVRIPAVRRIVTGEPVMVMEEGVVLTQALLQARLTEDEIRAAIRSAGIADLGMVRAVVYETDGSLSIVRQGDTSEASSLKGVRKPKESQESKD